MSSEYRNPRPRMTVHYLDNYEVMYRDYAYHWNGSTNELQPTETGFVVYMKEGFKTSTGLDKRIAHKMDLISKWPLKYYWLSDNQLLVVFRRWNHQAADRNVLSNFSVLVLRDCFTFDVVKVEKY